MFPNHLQLKKLIFRTFEGCFLEYVMLFLVICKAGLVKLYFFL